MGLQTGEKCIARWHNCLVLNGQNLDVEVNCFKFEQFDQDGLRTYYNSWITDIDIMEGNIEELVPIGRRACMSMNVIYRFIAKEIKVDFPLLE